MEIARVFELSDCLASRKMRRHYTDGSQQDLDCSIGTH